MATEVHGFKCDMCGSIRETAELADDCERLHGKDFTAKYFFERNKLGPEYVEVEITKPNGEKFSRTYY